MQHAQCVKDMHKEEQRMWRRDTRQDNVSYISILREAHILDTAFCRLLADCSRQ